MANESLQYPDYYPDWCPPSNAKFEKIKAYRLCKSDTVTESDFKSYFEEGKANFTGNKNIDVKFYGLSVYRSTDDCNALKRRSPKLRKYRIASGLMYECMGVSLHTPNSGDSHTTWWLYKDAKPDNYFASLPETST